jgi:hypothetical protein
VAGPPTANTESCRIRSSLAQRGHAGTADPRTSVSNV